MQGCALNISCRTTFLGGLLPFLTLMEAQALAQALFSFAVSWHSVTARKMPSALSTSTPNFFREREGDSLLQLSLVNEGGKQAACSANQLLGINHVMSCPCMACVRSSCRWRVCSSSHLCPSSRLRGRVKSVVCATITWSPGSVRARCYLISCVVCVA